MNEIITIQIGQGGNQIGTKFWETISYEHGIRPDRLWSGDDERQRECIDVFYNKETGGRYFPRTILVDLDDEQSLTWQELPFGSLFRPKNCMILNIGGADKNWAKGFYTHQPQFVDDILDAVYKEANLCDSLQGFMIFHTLGGGTGAGLGSLLLARLRAEFPEKTIVTCSVFPSLGVNDSVVKPYNTTLAIEHLIKNADLTLCIDNQQLYDICFRSFGLTSPTYDDLNTIATQMVSGFTAPLRFPLADASRLTLKDLVEHLVPSPHLKFITPGLAPLLPSGSRQYHGLTLQELIPKMLDANNMIAAADPRQGKSLSASASFRGNNIWIEEISEQMAKLQAQNADCFLSSSPNSIKNWVCEIPTTGLEHSVTFANNTTAIQSLLMRFGEEFEAMFRRKAFLNWYTDEGMDEQAFMKAERSLNDLIFDYQRAGGEW